MVCSVMVCSMMVCSVMVCSDGVLCDGVLCDGVLCDGVLYIVTFHQIMLVLLAKPLSRSALGHQPCLQRPWKVLQCTLR